MIDLKIRYKNRKKDQFKDASKEERAKALGNVICPRCKYQNHDIHMEHVIYVALHLIRIISRRCY